MIADFARLGIDSLPHQDLLSRQFNTILSVHPHLRRGEDNECCSGASFGFSDGNGRPRLILWDVETQ